MSVERRVTKRKAVDSIHIADLTSLNNYTVIAQEGYIVDASTTGFLLQINRDQLVSVDLKNHLTLDELIGQNVALYLPQMNLDLDGIITCTRHKGQGLFEVAIDFSRETPKYWKECLIELLPEPGEMTE